MNSESPGRTYKQTARAKAAEETARRILAAFDRALEQGWFEDIRLEDVAAEAEVSTQTVIRRFGGKDGLLQAWSDMMYADVLAHRKLPVGDALAAVDAILDEYERRGDLILRLLAQEDRYPPIRTLTDRGRETHRDWTGKVFEPWLREMDGLPRRDAHDRLVIALDFYVWKLLRLDMKRSHERVRRTMLEMAAQALGISLQEFELGRTSASETIDD